MTRGLKRPKARVLCPLSFFAPISNIDFPMQTLVYSALYTPPWSQTAERVGAGYTM